MKKLVILIVLLAVAGALAWKFYPDATKEIADKAKLQAGQLAEKAKTEAEAIRARVMAKQGVELHSDAKPLTVQTPTVDDIHYHVWYFTEHNNAFIMGDKDIYIGDMGKAEPYKTHKSRSDMTEDPNGTAFTSESMVGVWEVVKIENDELTLKYGSGKITPAKRLTGEEAKAVQAKFDAWKAKQAGVTP
ncbi:MAG: hypothetical protein KDN22_26895 [Verrucomicrobiae bacterium]|nr:hypothetical protein [Verrucomicrobiae bacterium]